MPWKTKPASQATPVLKKSKPMPKVRAPKQEIHSAPKKLEAEAPYEGELYIPDVPGKPPYSHQITTAEFSLANHRILDLSDAGTGKSRSHLIAWATRRKAGGGKMLVLSPKTVMFPAWVGDLMQYYKGEFIASVAEAHNRAEAFARPADVYITNLDAVKWLAKQSASWWERLGCDTLIVDESEAFKHRTSQRSKAAAKVASRFKYYAGLSGTPQNKSVTELWHQAYLADYGYRLGTEFFRFRAMCCQPEQIGPKAEHVRWLDIEGIDETVASMLADITVRHEFEKCLDIPKNAVRTIEFDLSPEHLKKYLELKERSVVELERERVSAINAAVLYGKLFQMASGAVYASEDNYEVVDTARYELIIELVAQRSWPCVVFFQWTHQSDELIREAEKRGIGYEYIDGTVSNKKRKEIVEKYQAGYIQVVFIHPKSGAHGITLTKGRTTIWASPTREPNTFKQGNHRIFRAGQKHKTETLLITARGTLEEQVFEDLQHRGEKMRSLLDILSS